MSLQSQSAEFIAFPVSRRVADVRRAAETLYKTHGTEAAIFWKKLIRSIADPLIAAGVHEDDVREQVLHFQDAVQFEMQMLASETAN